MVAVMPPFAQGQDAEQEIVTAMIATVVRLAGRAGEEVLRGVASPAVSLSGVRSPGSGVRIRR